MHQKTFLGVVGGSGLYELPGLKNVKEHKVSTPFGEPSDAIVVGEVEGRQVAFLPRHGKGHRLTPSEVNYAANIYALKSLGVNHILSVSAVGSLQQKYPPGTVVIPRQVIDRTFLRRRSFFGDGIGGHVSFGDPFCPFMQKIVSDVCEADERISAFCEGVLVAIEGPRFSSRAESESFRQLGCAVVGMTAMPEAALAREAEIPYVTLAFVTDYDCWNQYEESVTVEAVLEVLRANVETSKRLVKAILLALPAESQNPIFSAAQHAIMTAPQAIPADTRKKVELLYGKYLHT